MPVDSTNGPFYDVKTVTITSTGAQTINFDNVTDQTPKAVYAMISGNTLDDTVQDNVIFGTALTTNDDRGCCVFGLKDNEERLKEGYINHAVASNGSDKMWICGGATPSSSAGVATLLEINLTTGAITKLADAPTTVQFATLTYYNDAGTDKLFLFGGRRGFSSNSNLLTEYNATTNTWTARATASTGVQSHSTVLYSDALYAFGGVISGVTSTNIIQKYDIATNTWSSEDDGTRTGNPGDTSSHQAVVSGTNMYVHSLSTPFSTSNDLRAYNFSTQTWSNLTNSGTAVREAAMEVIGGNIYVVGGVSAAENLLQIYNIAGNSWSSGTNVPIPVSNARAVTDGTDLLVVGGDADDNGVGYRFYPNSKYIQKYDVGGTSWSVDYFDNIATVQYQDFHTATYSATALPWVVVPDWGNPSSGNRLEIDFDGFGSGSIDIDVTSKSQDFRVTFVMLAGNNLADVKVGEVSNGGSASIGFEPDFVLTLSSSATANDQVQDNPSICFGAACNRSTDLQRSLSVQVEQNRYDLDYSSRDSVWHMRHGGSNVINYENTLTFSGTGFSLSSTEADIPATAIYLALRLDAGVTEEAYYSRELIENTDLTANVASITGVGYEPGLVLAFSPRFENSSSEPSSTEDGYSFSTFTENEQSVVSIFSDGVTTPPDAQSRSVDGEVLNTRVENTSPLSATLQSMDSDGFSLLFSDFTTSGQNLDYYFFTLPGLSSSGSPPPSGSNQPVVCIITS